MTFSANWVGWSWRSTATLRWKVSYRIGPKPYLLVGQEIIPADLLWTFIFASLKSILPSDEETGDLKETNLDPMQSRHFQRNFTLCWKSTILIGSLILRLDFQSSANPCWKFLYRIGSWSQDHEMLHIDWKLPTSKSIRSICMHIHPIPCPIHWIFFISWRV